MFTYRQALRKAVPIWFRGFFFGSCYFGRVKSCPSYYFKGATPCCDKVAACDECWNSPYKGEILLVNSMIRKRMMGKPIPENKE